LIIILAVNTKDESIMINKFKIIVYALIVIPVSVVFLSCSSNNNGILSKWVQYGPSGSVIARIISDQEECPDIIIDNNIEKMSVRDQPDSDFEVLTCETIIPQGTETVSIEGNELVLPKPSPTRMVVIGDTGCRLETGDVPQSCNDPDAWPFEKIANTAASFDPELVIHVGDYLYREDDACPPGDEGCAGSPFGDNYPTWDADFFQPAKLLLETATWVFSRGNHEECSRSGKGWFRFLDPHALPPECEDYTTPYTVDLGLLKLLILDSSLAKDNSAPSVEVEVYTEQIAELEDAAGSNAWLVTHHPLWGIGEENDALFMINETLQASTDNTLAEGVNLVLSGHIHFFEFLNFEDGRAPQFVIGNSGTELDPPVTEPLTGIEIGGGVIDQGVTVPEFGFALMELTGNIWNVSMRDVDGNEFTACQIEGNVASCN